MSKVIDLNESRMVVAANRGFRNWKSHFNEDFDLKTRISHLSRHTLCYLAQGRDKGTFLLYDLIMNLKGLGSGFEFEELNPQQKILVIDQYLFLLDRIRFECMKRLGWLEAYPGEEYPLVELIVGFEGLGPSLHAKIPVLSPGFPVTEEYSQMNTFDKDVYIRKLIPKALEAIESQSTTL
ncbi:conserved hypothetical protein [uncultured Desulfobacterium sp.]|uniref:Uncharacterized protein n=1 Tax=uncultured Desulfobacterium sp. TaxID=201089 RepID=A0A445MSU2_9BACT|nr:conserved hypothetical protein [uncultured Desulfobacterium sp.]